MHIIDFTTGPLSGIAICAQCVFLRTCSKKPDDILKPENCDEYLAMYKIIEQKIDTGEILYDHYKNKYGREFRERN